MKHLNKDSKPHIVSVGRSKGRHAAPAQAVPKRREAKRERVEAPASCSDVRTEIGGKSRRCPSPRSRRIQAVVCWGLLILFVAALVIYVLHLNSRQRAYEQLAGVAHRVSQTYMPPAETAPLTTPDATEAPSAEFVVEPELTPAPGPAEIPIDFDYLCDINDDIIGWIMVDGTDIDYPVLYDSAESWSYIDHDYWLNYSFSGSIYVKDENDSDFSDFNTVIYGHNMNDGSMFAPLHDFRNQEFFDQHDTIILYTPDRKLTYKIFAAYRTDNKNLSVVFDYDTAEQREDYLEHVYSHTTIAFFDMDVPVSTEDKIITLSTCIDHQSAYRYLVQAVLISDQPGVCISD